VYRFVKNKKRGAVNMSIIKQSSLEKQGKNWSVVRNQCSALCYRVKQEHPLVLLITTRRSGRWIVPKGWPMVGETPARAAAREAWEEAGVQGTAGEICVGLYIPGNSGGNAGGPCVAMLYPLRVTALSDQFPERDQRRRIWVSPARAAALVAEPELARILRDFDPRVLH
jgi:8-oxo-dGTP pyrophosphatase MutT (NUDIX family)